MLGRRPRKVKTNVAWVGTSISKQLDRNKFERDLNNNLKFHTAYCIKDETDAFYRQTNKL